MELQRIGFRGRACLLLGAGATRGASFVQQQGSALPNPPLDADFFTQIQRLCIPSNREIVRRLLRFTVGEFGVGFSLTMERFFAQVEALPQVFSQLRISKGRSFRQPETAMALFKQALAGVFQESLVHDTTRGGNPKRCGHHNRLVGSLNGGDAVITFNYDCVLEESLRINCRYWDPRKSYKLTTVGGDVDYWKYQVRKVGHPITHALPVLKMHGSMNWRRVGGRVELTRSPYDLDGNYEIVPPQWQKDVLRPGSVFLPIWREARRRLELARCLIVVGYSAPMTDLLAQTLLRCRNRPAGKTVGNNFFDVLIIANPDRESRRHLLRLLNNSIGDQTRVLTFESLEQCAHYLVPAPSLGAPA